MKAALYPPQSAAERRASLSQSARPWQQCLREAVTDADTLCDLLDLPAAYRVDARRAATLFPLRVPRGFVARMRVGDIHDPLLRQILPLDAEHERVPGFTIDAVGDDDSAAGDGLLHKYHGRALVVTTGACAIHCRYCFRRHFDYAENNAGRNRWRNVLARIAADDSIEEVILSGGDPLSLSDRRLAELTDGLADIAHVRRLRFHTRQPVVLPERIDRDFLRYFEAIERPCVVVIHANHANELDGSVGRALAQLRSAGAVLLNQSVLLRGVNDNVTALRQLSQRLFEIGVLPYYLHLLDRVAGTAHFEVAADAAEKLMQELAGRLPGYMVPKLARETSGATAKSVIGYRAPTQYAN